MDSMMREKRFDVANAKQGLWMNASDLVELHGSGNVIGLHSHSHPTRFDQLTDVEQKAEYGLNLSVLEKTIGAPIVSMSHPCGRYNSATLNVLSDLGIKLGFRNDMQVFENAGAFEQPRLDCASILLEIRG